MKAENPETQFESPAMSHGTFPPPLKYSSVFLFFRAA